MSRPSTVGTVLAAVLLAGLTSCGEEAFEDKPVADIMAATQDDTNALESAHVEGTITGGENGDDLGLDLTLSRAGACLGSVERQGATLAIMVVDGRVFYRPDQAFYAQNGYTEEGAAEAVDNVGERWLEGTQEKGSDDLAKLCDLDQLLEKGEKSFFGADPDIATGKLNIGDTSEVGGVEAVELRGTFDDDKVSVFVAVEDPHHVVRLKGKNAGADADLVFSEWDVPVKAEVPSSAEIFVP